MRNGDVLEGVFKGIVDENIIWQTAYLGELKIAKARAKNIHSQQVFKLRGQATPCTWQSLEKHIAKFVCHRGEVRAFPLLSLQQVVPFEGHQKANHSYGGNLRITGLKKEGNAAAEYWEVHCDVVLRHGDWRHAVALSSAGQSLILREGESTSEDKDRRDRGELTLDWFFLPRYYLSNVFSVEADSNRNIQEEYKFSSGLGYQFWELENTSLAVVVGLEHNATYLKLNPLPNEPERYTSARLGTDFRYKFKSGAKFYHTNTYSYALNSVQVRGGVKRWEFKSNSGVNFPIGFGISADMNIEWNYKNHAKDQDPNAFKTDVVYRVGVNYSW